MRILAPIRRSCLGAEWPLKRLHTATAVAIIGALSGLVAINSDVSPRGALAVRVLAAKD